MKHIYYIIYENVDLFGFCFIRFTIFYLFIFIYIHTYMGAIIINHNKCLSNITSDMSLNKIQYARKKLYIIC